MVVVEQEVDELEFKATEILRKGEKGFEVWLKSKDIQELENIIGLEECPQEAKDYIEWVKSHESLKVCSSCRWQHGCESCCYEHALRYVIRHRKPAKWWLRKTGQILRAKVRDKKKGRSIYFPDFRPTRSEKNKK